VNGKFAEEPMLTFRTFISALFQALKARSNTSDLQTGRWEENARVDYPHRDNKRHVL
jgi:hypothetical protein